jgi:hypothetical protein
MLKLVQHDKKEGNGEFKFEVTPDVKTPTSGTYPKQPAKPHPI